MGSKQSQCFRHIQDPKYVEEDRAIAMAYRRINEHDPTDSLFAIRRLKERCIGRNYAGCAAPGDIASSRPADTFKDVANRQHRVLNAAAIGRPAEQWQRTLDVKRWRIG